MFTIWVNGAAVGAETNQEAAITELVEGKLKVELQENGAIHTIPPEAVIGFSTDVKSGQQETTVVFSWRAPPERITFDVTKPK